MEAVRNTVARTRLLDQNLANGNGTIDLPPDDRVANTTMSLLFQPLIEGREERIEFQAFLCRGGARLMNFVALANGGAGAVREVCDLVLRAKGRHPRT